MSVSRRTLESARKLCLFEKNTQELESAWFWPLDHVPVSRFGCDGKQKSCLKHLYR